MRWLVSIMFGLLKGVTMRKISFLFSVLVLGLACVANAATDWIIDLDPGVIYFNSSANDFDLQRGVEEESLSIFSSFPRISTGVSVEQPEGYFDARVGVGMLLNNSLSTTAVFGQLAYSYEIKPSIMIGPHIGYSMYSAPEWWGDAEVEFDSTSGYMLGGHLTMGDKIAYIFSVDMVNAEYDVKSTSGGWSVANGQTTLDLSGLMISFGFLARF